MFKKTYFILKKEGLFKALKHLFNYLLKHQFIRFCIVGTIGVIFNYSIFFIMLYFFNILYLISSATGFISAIFLAFTLNKSFTFKIKKSNNLKNTSYFIKYTLVVFISLGIGLSFLWLLVDILKINPYISNVLNIGLTTITNFTGSKYFAFKGGIND